MRFAGDLRLVLVATFVRATAVGMVGVLLGAYLPHLGLSGTTLGAVVGAGLAGVATGMLLVTLWGDRRGHRRVLVDTAVFSVSGGVALALASSPWLLGVAAFLGMVNGMGRDRGAALVVETAVLPAIVDEGDENQRTRVFAWYNVLQDAGHAVGALAAMLPPLLRALGIGPTPSFRIPLVCAALAVGATVFLYQRLSPVVERRNPEPVRVAPESRRLLVRISSLFALDSLGGGFMTTALVAWFFHERFGAGEIAVAMLFALARVANALSHLGAAWLARRIGLVNTMVFTHIPSSLLLVTVPWAPSFAVAAVLFLIREGLVEMDVPTRQSYVMAVVRPEERTVASGVTQLVRTGAWAVAPFFAGPLMAGVSLATPLYIGAGMKIVYDVLLFAACRRVRPPEER